VALDHRGSHGYSNASMMAPEKMDILIVGYTMYIKSAVQLKAEVRHARFTLNRQLGTDHPSR
jgi:hypothetical protein